MPQDAMKSSRSRKTFKCILFLKYEYLQIILDWFFISTQKFLKILNSSQRFLIRKPQSTLTTIINNVVNFFKPYVKLNLQIQPNIALYKRKTRIGFFMALPAKPERAFLVDKGHNQKKIDFLLTVLALT